MCPWSFPAAFPFVSEFIGTTGRHSWGTVIVWSFSDPREMCWLDLVGCRGQGEVCRPASQYIFSSVVRGRLMDGWRMVPPSCHLISAVLAREDKLKGGSCCPRIQEDKELLSDAALELKKSSVSKTQVSNQILGILCEVLGGVFVSFNVCTHVVSLCPTCLGRRKGKGTSVGKRLCSPPTLSSLTSHHWVCAGAAEP